VDLLHAPGRIDHMLKYRLRDDTVEGCVGEGQVVPVTNHLSARPDRHVGFDELNARLVDQHVNAVTHNTPSDDKHGRIVAALHNPITKLCEDSPRGYICRRIWQTTTHQTSEPMDVLEEGLLLLQERFDIENAVRFVDQNGSVRR